jgi:glycosyltransferase involved in cell wall biosynthesis
MVYDRLNLFDIVHNHSDFFMFPLVLGNDKVPILTTLHRPIDVEEAKVLRSFPSINYLALSYDQKKNAEEQNIKILDVVYNGINPKEYEFNNNPEDYFLYLGRLNKEKGVVAAIEIAKAADKKLVVAGNIAGPAEWNYFFRDVQPRLNSEKISFVGEVDFKEKMKLLKNAKALLFPINRREPFGLVMIEAMACGTPVIAFNKGSVPEVVEDKKTGFIVESKEQMIDAMEHINKIKRRDCRKSVEKNFTLKQMVDKYEEIYKKLIS